jgi:hypothetical protein
MNNSRAKPPGLREAIAKAFLDAFAEDLGRHAGSAIQRVREDKPTDYLRIAVSLLPKEWQNGALNLDDMSDEELSAALGEVRALIAAKAARPADDDTAS